MFKLFIKYYSISKTERRILNRTFFRLFYALILVRFIPLRWFNHLLGEFKKETDEELTSNQMEIIRWMQKSIRRWKRYLPWKVKCFEEAIAAKKVLEKYKIQTTLYLGVDKNTDKQLIAHAWLKSRDVFITGEQGNTKYKIVGYYS